MNSPTGMDPMATLSWNDIWSLSITVKTISKFVSLEITSNTNFWLNTGFRVCFLHDVLKVFLPNDITTKGSISKLLFMNPLKGGSPSASSIFSVMTPITVFGCTTFLLSVSGIWSESSDISEPSVLSTEWRYVGTVRLVIEENFFAKP